jgi:hypothetical protein
MIKNKRGRIADETGHFKERSKINGSVDDPTYRQLPLLLQTIECISTNVSGSMLAK